ncbi:MAG: TonB-dependent receptor plug domain-containing protein, partial [Bacteroidetes bacterium]|nr:TonB-dependent receptor plug domain-containing protein [Bacteroidota bacterium]
MDEIHKQTGYTYAGESNFTQYSHRVSISAHKAPLIVVLDSIFRDQPVTFEIVGMGIIINRRPVRDQNVHGWVFNDKREPLEGVTILVRGEPMTAAVSRVTGEFSIHMHFADDRLVISSVGYEMQEVEPREGEDAVVYLKERIGELSDVVVVHNGYTEKTLKASTGSSDVVGTTLISRRVSTSLLDRIDGVTSSVLFNKNIQANTNQSSITIRGRSTIFANPNPLIVIDNFPYYGDIGNINPEDVESVTILKDAASAAIWGAFSGNGVIVITTKKGRINQSPKWSFTTSQTIGEKPDLYYQPALSSSDYIDIQQFLYRNKFYAGVLSPFQHGAVTPAVEIFDATSKGVLSSGDSAAQINALKGQDVRRDLNKYFYQRSLNSQYVLNVSGGGPKNTFYLSGGFDENRSDLVRNLYKRVTLNGSNTYLVLQDKMEVTTGVSFANSKFYNNNTTSSNLFYPYASFADANGNPLPINVGFKNSYIDTAGGGQLLDWHYVPLNELKNSDNIANLADYRINVGLKYMVRKGLDLRVYYQYGWGDSISSNYQNIQTFYTRNLINSYAQFNNGLFFYPVPQGGILDEVRNTYTANSARLQVNYQDSLFRHGLLNAAGGAELRDIEGESRRTRLYGYEKGVGISAPVNYDTLWPQYPSFGTAKIPYYNVNGSTAERYISYYINGDYTYLGRYTVSASARWDESNLFGVKTNQRGVPLWSVG